jgi:O-succinylbenzoic acid--CoA ligase
VTLSVTAAAREAPHETALVTDSERLDYDSLANRVLARIEELERVLGRPLCGQRVGLVARLDRASVVDILALMEAQAKVALIHDRLPPQRRLDQLRAAGVAAVIDGEHIEKTEYAPGHEPWDVLIFTSGSSASPKGVRLSRENFAAAAAMSAENLGWRAGDRWLANLPLAHVGGLSVLTRCLLARKAVVLSERPAGEAITTHEVTLASLVPSQLDRLMADAPTLATSSLRACLVGGAATAPARVTEARAAGLPLLLTWGMSETTSQIATQPLHLARSPDPRDAEHVGPPLPGVSLRVSPDGAAAVRGDNVMLGYLGAGASHLDADGYFETGDRVEVLSGGTLRVLGRDRDLVISGGENVSPTSVAHRLVSEGVVRDAFVFGQADARWGEIVVAVVVLQGGGTLEAVDAWARTHLPPWERPKRVVVVEALPLGPNGKVDRAAARALLEASEAP